MAETLPPIHSSRGSLASESHSHPMSDSSTSSARAGNTAATTAVAAPTSAVDELAARLAKRIWAGSKEEDGYVTMITRVRQQFLAQSSEIDPLVLPPMVPSSQRPVEPEIPQFSRRLQAFQPSERSKSGRKAIMPAKGEESSTATSAAVPPSAASVAQLPSVPAGLRPLFSRQHKKQQTDVERIKQQMAAAEAEDYSYVPMYNLPGRRAKALRLLELEQLSREHIFASEKWNRQLVSEMMIVSYVTGVLKPEVEELLTKERHVRSAVRAEEEGEWCALLHQHPLAETIQRELAAIAARESKLARLEPHRPPKANSGNSSPAERKSPRDNETDPRDIVANYEKHNKRNSTSLTVLSPTDNTTQQLLHNNVSLPPIAGRPVLRNALGLADCMALIDEDAQRRHLIMSAEVDEREDLMGIAHDEHTAIRNWQRKRMHLERLIYWKVEREEHLQTELNRMTDVRQAAVTLDPETEHHLLAQEEEERVELTLRATEGVSKLMKRLQELHLRHYHDRLEAEYERAWTIEWESSCRMRMVLVQYHEQFLREQCVHAWRSWAKTDATAAYTSVSALAAAALNRPKLWAIYRLQRAFRKCILGRFGWHHTHVEIGREIQTGRIQRKVEEGRAAINTCKDSIAHSFRKIEAEIDAEFDARKVVVVAEEKEARFAIDTQELWGFGLIRQHCRKEQQNNFHGPESARLQGDERTTRTEDVLREEVVRGKLEVLRQEKQIQ